MCACVRVYVHVCLKMDARICGSPKRRNDDKRILGVRLSGWSISSHHPQKVGHSLPLRTKRSAIYSSQYSIQGPSVQWCRKNGVVLILPPFLYMAVPNAIEKHVSTILVGIYFSMRVSWLSPDYVYIHIYAYMYPIVVSWFHRYIHI